MSIAEAALYGDLVKYLRDRWAEQAAEFNESAIDEERNRIDELIRSWFFAPRSDLHGLTPREIIRCEPGVIIDRVTQMLRGVDTQEAIPLQHRADVLRIRPHQFVDIDPVGFEAYTIFSF